MDKFSLISMFITFVTSNDVLKYEPQGALISDVKWSPPSFCNGLDCPIYKKGMVNKEFEERIYAPADWVATDLLNVDYSAAGSEMFMKLFRYIQGANTEKQKIAMTCPVTTRIIPSQGPECESNFTMSFYIAPKVKQIPQPTEKDVRLRKSDSLRVYVRQFGGYARKFEDWSKEAIALGKALDAQGLTYEKSHYYTAGYDSPFRVFNRHNEIWFLAKSIIYN